MNSKRLTNGCKCEDCKYYTTYGMCEYHDVNVNENNPACEAYNIEN